MKLDIARELAIKILYQIEEENGYSNLVLDQYLEKNREKLTLKDINFISELVYGTVTWKLTIDKIIQKYSKIKMNKISKWVLPILRTGVYQIVFLDKVPKSAAVNESVNLCKKYGFKSSNFVNAILRKVEKEDYQEFEKIEDPISRISVMYSMPKWLIEKLFLEYDAQTIEKICENSNQRPNMTIRMNDLKIGEEDFIKKLEERKITYEKAESPNFFYLKNLKNVSHLDLFLEGLFTIQDEGAGKISLILEPKPGEKVLDICSAPGGKTTHMAQLMKNKGYILACDLYEHRVKLVKENAKRLGITCIHTQVKDALEFNPNLEEQFDKILLDVPCLGFGVMKRKPDIKWQRKKEDMEEICKIQEKILENCSRYLKIGGEMVYSTCSILKEENENIIQNFLKQPIVEKDRKKHKFVIEMTKKILPEENTDGFFISKIKKMRT